MRTKNILNAFVKATTFAVALFACGVASADVVDVYLQTQSYTKDLPNTPLDVSDDVPMWRYVCDAGAAASAGADNTECNDTGEGSAQISVSAGDDLTIHLANTLPVLTSIIVPGQAESAAGAPTFFTDGAGRSRVKSMTHEAGAGSGTDSYTFTGIRAGTYLYQSGSYPSIQVPMGLHGALVVRDPVTTFGGCAPGQQAAYDDADSCYNDEIVMLFSEVDPLQNAAVDDAGSDVTSYPSTIDFSPSYLLINGSLSPDLTGIGDDTGASPVASRVLLRMLNAGLHSHTPAIVGLDMTLVAEDGYLYPGLPKIEAQALLPAGKTIDALVDAPGENRSFGMYDSTPGFSNADLPQGAPIGTVIGNGGTPASPPPTTYAVNDVFPVTEDSSLLGADVLFNDVGLAGATVTAVNMPAHAASFTMNPDGTFDYTPELDFSGSDSFTYVAELAGESYPAQVALNVSFVNDPPVAAADGPYTSTMGGTIVVNAANGVLGNDTDVDGDTLTAVIDGPAPAGLTLNADGSFSYNGGSNTSFSYRADDGAAQSDPIAVDLVYAAPSNISLTVVDPTGYELTEYRWIVQENTTWSIDDPNAAPPLLEQQSLNFHKSSMPVIAQGCRGCTPDVDNDPTGNFPGEEDIDMNRNGVLDAEVPFSEVALDSSKRYYVSVLPNDAGTGQGHTIGGAEIEPNQTDVTVLVNKQEIPTSQVAVIVFEDIQPTNGVPDPNEEGLGFFQIVLEDAGGRYGASGGTMSQDAFGNPLTNSLPCAPPSTPGVILTCPDGTALIENLPPAKYGIFAVAPPGPETWTQTSTIEGSKIIDAWVEAGNPPFFSEFGVPAFHAFIGFVNPANTVVDPTIPPGQRNNTIVGNVTLIHESRPPNVDATDAGSYEALSFTQPWVGVNTAAGSGPNIATVQAEPDGTFTLEGIPDGTHQLVIWDKYNDTIIAYHTVIVDGGGVTDAGNIPVNAWFARAEHNVYLDVNQNGVRDDGEPPLAEQNVNLRWRDGTINQAFPTDLEGFVPFDTIFPFFHWQVWEVDFARFKPTGLTVTVDAGGDVSGGPYPGILNPQIQDPSLMDPAAELCTPGTSCQSRTEPGPVLTEAWQGFSGQTSIFDWGKAPYSPGENGGIGGIVFYGSTRGEEDPRLTVGDPWEPGIADVKVRLYREVQTDFEGGRGLVLQEETTTDSWDASIPDGCPGEQPAASGDEFVNNTLGAANVARCYDGWRNWNQARPGVFDGGYAFTDIDPGWYVVEVVVPPGYELIKEQDMNVGFGDSYGPNNTYAPVSVVLPNGMVATTIPDQAMIDSVEGIEPGLAQPECVGLFQQVPGELSLFPGEPAPFATYWRPLCDRKRVFVPDQGQAAADFHLFTSTPVAAQFTGLITDDIATETNPAAPGFGEKWSPAYMPFALRDFNGNELYRGYSDAFGHFNGVLASTFTANIPIPSGYSPQMALTCLNDPGDGPIPDPNYDSAYGEACYTLQYMPGATTYLDTPILPHVAFAAGFNPVDCACEDGTPVINVVSGTGAGPLVAPGGTLTIESLGVVQVPNPEYQGPLTPGIQPSIERNYGFGESGMLSLDGVAVDGTDVSWSDGSITWSVPGGFAPGEYQLMLTRDDNGNTTKNAITVIVGVEDATVHRVSPAPYPATPIQDAIDAAAPGDLILVAPGIYDELVVMHKPVRLQGSGAATFINASKTPNAKLERWRDKIRDLRDGDPLNGEMDLVPGQPDEFNLVGTGLFANELGAGITVVALSDGSFGAAASRIDGLKISHADGGGAIFVNGYAHNLVISNNDLTDNAGVIHGGIRIGHAFLDLAGDGPFALNTNVNIHHNSVTRNGGMDNFAAGGGISINTGSDDYTVADNYVCGNFKLGNGAGIAHFGLSNNGMIEANEILFNQSYNQGLTRSGGGIFVGGEPPAAGGLTLGTGNVTIDGNLVQGNAATSGHGAGMRIDAVNGRDVENNPTLPDTWYAVTITNNMIVNNVAGWSGAGISLHDTLKATIVMNTIANNDSTATVGALIGATGVSTPQPAGVASERNTAGLANIIPDEVDELGIRRMYSNPELTHNIIWHNRAFYFDGTMLMPNLANGPSYECAPGANYIDVGVLDPAYQLQPRLSILTSTAGYPGNNSDGDPLFANEYCNGARKLAVPGPMETAAAAGEGGNFVDVRYGPLTTAWPAGSASWDYHITDASPARDHRAALPLISVPFDIDGDVRPTGARVDAGADEFVPGGGTPPPDPVFGTVDYSSGAFGAVPTNSTAEKVITAAVSVAPVTFTASSTPAAPFAKTGDTCSGNVVPVGGSCSITVTYSPTAVGADSDSITIDSDADGNPHTVNLSGSGVLPGVVEVASATFGSLGGGTLDFESQPNGNYQSTVTLSVGESTPVTFGSLSLSGSNRFTMVDDQCTGASVSPGGTCTFTIEFNANGNTTRNATVSFPHNGAGPTSLALTGS